VLTHGCVCALCGCSPPCIPGGPCDLCYVSCVCRARSCGCLCPCIPVARAISALSACASPQPVATDAHGHALPIVCVSLLFMQYLLCCSCVSGDPSHAYAYLPSNAYLASAVEVAMPCNWDSLPCLWCMCSTHAERTVQLTNCHLLELR